MLAVPEVQVSDLQATYQSTTFRPHIAQKAEEWKDGVNMASKLLSGTFEGAFNLLDTRCERHKCGLHVMFVKRQW
jgi:hypothetical protein